MSRVRILAGGGLALTLSAALHAAGLSWAYRLPDRPMMGGGGDAAPAALGHAFADFAAGVSAVRPDAAVAVDPLDRSAPRPVPVQPSPVQPDSSPPVAPADMPAVEPAGAAPAGIAEPIVPQPPALPQIASADLAAHARPDDPAALTEAPLAASAPSAARPVAPDETISPVPDDLLAGDGDAGMAGPPVASLRPVARPSPERRTAVTRSDPPAPRPQQPATPATPPASPGNAEADARRGSPDSSETGQAAATGSPSATAAEAGNAAATNYPGEVLRRITRLRRPAAPARGRVLVVFTIAPSGALASVSVASSSGAPELDRIALEHVQRAAPFPPPPPGALTTFSFEFVGRP